MERSGQASWMGLDREVGRELDPHTSGVDSGLWPLPWREMTENLGKRGARERLGETWRHRHRNKERQGETEGTKRHRDGDSVCRRRCIKTHGVVRRGGAGQEGGCEWGRARQGEEEGRREERGGHVACIVPGGGKERQTWNPGCSHRASLNRLGGQQIPDGPHLGGCGHPVAPRGSEGIVGLARRGWEYGAQDREPFTKPGWV